MSLSDVLLYVSIALGLGKTLYDVVKSRSESKKINADAAQVLVGISTNVAQELEADLKEMRDRVDALETGQREDRRLLRTFQLWTELAWARLVEAQIEIERPPEWKDR